MHTTDLGKTDVVILCGGLGTRIRPVLAGVPKILAPIGKETFLDLLFKWFRSWGFRRIILSTGYLGKEVKSHFKSLYDVSDFEVVISEEAKPLGTGGALKKALTKVRSDSVLVVNGDTIVSLDFIRFLDFYRQSGAVFSMALVKSERKDGGAVLLDDSGRIKGYGEKTGVLGGNCYLNGGVYLMQRGINKYFPSRRGFSLEENVFPRVIAKEKCVGFVTDGKHFDIGTPERYSAAVAYFSHQGFSNQGYLL